MISKEAVVQLAEAALEGSERFLVEVNVSARNKITVFVDSPNKIAISDCVEISRKIESGLDREAEDFELEVSSPGMDLPFRVFRQYQKNTGRKVSVLLRDGRKFEGMLKSAADNSIVLEQNKKVKSSGAKKKELVSEELRFGIDEIKETKLIISF